MNKGYKKTEDYLFFWGSEFSQWYKSDFKENEITFSTAEQYMMYNKALLFKDEEIAKKILDISNPKEIKALGRKISNFDEKIWDNNKLKIVIQGNILKFSQNEELKVSLLSHSGIKFVEASPYDRIWGIGLHYNDIRVEDKKLWEGQNLLGIALNNTFRTLKDRTKEDLEKAIEYVDWDCDLFETKEEFEKLGFIINSEWNYYDEEKSDHSTHVSWSGRIEFVDKYNDENKFSSHISGSAIAEISYDRWIENYGYTMEDFDVETIKKEYIGLSNGSDRRIRELASCSDITATSLV